MMKRFGRWILLGLCIYILCPSLAISQLHVGFLGGLTYSQFSGEQEEGETHSFQSGFQIGLRAYYDFTDWFAIGGGIGYMQKGSSFEYNGESYFRLPRPSGNDLIMLGVRDQQVRINTDHIEIPLFIQLSPIKRVKFYAGPYLSFMVGARGTGTVRFRDASTTSTAWDLETNIDANYYRDEAGFNLSFGSEPITIGGEQAILPDRLGAYFERDERDEGLYRPIDGGLIGGLNIFITSGLYLNGQISYGVTDITRDEVDLSIRDFNGGAFQFREDFDRFLTYSISIGVSF